MSGLQTWLQQALRQGQLRPIDRHFALLMLELGGNDEAVGLAAALVSRSSGEGHVCLSLAEQVGLPLENGLVPALADWRARLRASGVVGHPGEATPLILDDADRLYLARHWLDEQQLAQQLLARARPWPVNDPQQLRQDLARLFPARSGIDWQKAAAALAVLRGLAVISGGPGTGKTWTVTRILALLQGQASTPLRIGLAAPTGKAAARLSQSILAARSELPDGLGAAVPHQAQTLHRLLGARPDGSFRFHAEHRLPLDLLVVDEASMIDLALMARLLQALPSQARLILLGDRDQLASVEAGYVLGDICGPLQPPPISGDMAAMLAELCAGALPLPIAHQSSPMLDSVLTLQESRRFSADSPIGGLAQAVRAGDATTAQQWLQSGHEPLRWLPTGLEEALVAAVAGYRGYLTAATLPEALQALAGFQLLAALREGPFGVRQLNRELERRLALAGLLQPLEPFYHGRLILVTENDYGQGLFNGDLGLLWQNDGETLQAWFAQGDQPPRAIPPSRLPAHESAFAMTVHKSQGSEFDRVLLVLPEEDSPLLTRELLYTAITRARQQVLLRVTPELLQRALARGVSRRSALAERLWGLS